ncbi:hypothetical protein Hdeb2414_s0018g00517951 [Helianthus debilis subsp. tardiflorus]
MQLKLELRDRVNNLFKFFHKLTNLKEWHRVWKISSVMMTHIPERDYFISF